jgi:predicted dienelactone hydrolase
MASTWNRFIFAGTMLVAALGPARADDTGTPGLYKAIAGPMTVAPLDEVWRDAARDRAVPVRVYLPETTEAGATLPVVVFSHGMGGSREGGAYFGRHLASHGYMVIHAQHAGSDADAVRWEWRDARDPSVRLGRRSLRARLDRLIEGNTGRSENLRARPADVSFVLDRVGSHALLGPLADTGRVAVAGHSFGACTSMAVGGMLVDLPDEPDRSFRDPRVYAVIAMSPQGTGVMGIDAGAWDEVCVPVMHLTGTRDSGQGNRPWTWRLEAFEQADDGDWILVVIDGATHMAFSDARGHRVGRRADVETDHHIYILSACTAFLDAHLRDDAAASGWLGRLELVAASGGVCEVRVKANTDGPESPASPDR